MNKRTYSWLILAVLVIVMLPMAGCSPKVEYPPYYKEASGAFGQDVEAVIAQMGLTMEDFEYRDSIYWYKETVEYLGYNFQMRLITYRMDAAREVCGIMYLLNYDAVPEEAANAAIDIRNKLMEGYGESYVASKYMTERPRLETITFDEMLEIFSDKSRTDGTAYGGGLKWILSKDLSTVPEDIQESYAPNCISMRFGIGYPVADSLNEEGLGTALIKLEYGLTTDDLTSGK